LLSFGPGQRVLITELELDVRMLFRGSSGVTASSE
jgi:hypothetical protein